MNLNKNYIKKRIPFKQKDCFITIFLTKTCEIYEYVDIKKDEKIYKIDKQTINPYYINFGFFNTTKRIKINKAQDLTSDMISYLSTTYFDSINKYGTDILTWFEEIGYNILINDITTTIDDTSGEKKQENGLDKLEKLKSNTDSVISKTYFFPISVNK